MQYEIGLTHYHSGAAERVIGPFDDDEDACEVMMLLNFRHGGEPRWRHAHHKEIRRKPDCVVIDPAAIMRELGTLRDARAKIRAIATGA